ncbi:unnamed protein product [Lactuca virosa]|uniref:Pentatricopeptide repeat-containing protein n=1 Tax=Lactuca virosa TaxID=75947 RepID=A0AAU9MT97_9ASTR|nr:unnamed protein product [Lactuca virosa]
MQTQGLYPDPSIFITIITRLGEQGKWDIIKKNFEQMKGGGHGQSGTIYAVLVDIYGQYGSFEDGEDCINTLKLEEVPLSARIFCVLANVYAQRGLCEQTVKVLQLMTPFLGLLDFFNPSSDKRWITNDSFLGGRDDKDRY